jgi:hypothetical protein
MPTQAKQVKTNWKHKKAQAALERAMVYFGKPNILAPQKGGIAIWDKKHTNSSRFKKYFGLSSVFERCELRDEAVKHNCPKPHTDNFYSYIKVDINPKQLMKVLSLSGSVGYDPLKKELYARCADIEPNIATLMLAMKIINNKITIQRIQRNNLYKQTIVSYYGNSIEVKKGYRMLYDEIKDHKKNNNLKHTGFWKAAFKNDRCGKGIYG